MNAPISRPTSTNILNALPSYAMPSEYYAEATFDVLVENPREWTRVPYFIRDLHALLMEAGIPPERVTAYKMKKESLWGLRVCIGSTKKPIAESTYFQVAKYYPKHPAVCTWGFHRITDEKENSSRCVAHVLRSFSTRAIGDIIITFLLALVPEDEELPPLNVILPCARQNVSGVKK